MDEIIMIAVFIRVGRQSHSQWVAFIDSTLLGDFLERLYPRPMQRITIQNSLNLANTSGFNCVNTGYSFQEITLAVCHTKRSSRHRVFAGLARWGRNSMGWCYGFKLHLLINDVGDLLACRLTAANVDERVPVPALVKRVTGKVFWRIGAISHKPYLLTSLRRASNSLPNCAKT
jgi:hypothetical protein